jgi:antirestriction protein
MNPKESKGAVICIKFSPRGDFLAVSFDNEKIGKNPGELRTSKFDTSFVQLYVNRHSSKALSYPSNSKALYVKAYKIVLPLADFHSSIEKRNTSAVSQMDFSNDDLFLQMCSMKIDQEHVRNYVGGEDIFAVWDIENNELVNDYDQLKRSDWVSWTVSNAIYSRFLGNSLQAENPEEESKLRAAENCIMSACQKLPSMNAVCGNTQGDIFLFRFPALFIDKSRHLEFSIDNLLKKDMALTRSYSAHSSMVMYTENFGEYTILTVGVEDQ